MNMQFPQGRIPSKKLIARCPHCKKYPTDKEGKGVKMKYHLSICEDNPANKKEE